MKSAVRQIKKVFWLVMTVGFVVMIIVSQAQKTCAQQWTSNGVNIYYNAGTVSIGTTNPGKLLTVNGDAGITTLYGNSTSLVANDWLKLGPGSNGNLFIDNLGAGGLAQTMIGFNTTKTAGSNFVFSVFNNSADRNLLFSAQSAGTGSGSNQVIFPTGNVGIGTATPTSRLHVYGDNNLTTGTYIHTMITGSQTTANSSGEYVGFDVNPYYTATGTLNLMYGTTSYPFNSGSGTINALYGHAASPLNLGSGNVGAMTGVVSTPGNYGSGSVGSLYGEYAWLQNMGTGTVTNAYSLFIDNPAKATSATIGNNYGIYIANQTAATNNYAIYSAGGPSYFAGYVGIGNGSPAYPLDVSGQIHATGGFRFNDNTVQTTAATITGMTAGAGLTGSTSNGIANFDIGQGTGVTVAADSISVNYGSSAGTAVEGSKQITITTDVNSGLTGGAALTLGSGPSFTLANTDKGSSQSIFKNVANDSGQTQFSAGSPTTINNNDTIRFAGTGRATVSFDPSLKQVTIDGSAISQWTTSGSNINYATAGNVGIGTPSPGSKLDVTGNTNITGDLNVTGHINARYQDVAEWVPTSAQLPAGTVVVLDSNKSNQVISSTQAYDTRVAGVVSEQPGIELGEGGAGKVLVAATGRVRVNVDASRGAIHIGDLLVTSDITGVAMKSEPINLGGVQLHRPGTLIGKALEPLEKGSGKILVLLSLQ